MLHVETRRASAVDSVQRQVEKRGSVFLTAFSALYRPVELPQFQRIFAVLADEVDDVVVGLGIDVVGDGVIGLEDIAAATYCVEFGEDFGAQQVEVVGREEADVYVAVERPACTIAAIDVGDVEAGIVPAGFPWIFWPLWLW